MTEIYGNTSGLAPSAKRALERVYRRRVPMERIATPELIRSLAEASRETKRQVGALVHRSGVVDYVVVGSATGLMLPDIGRLRAAQGRFRALRLVHTHLFGEPITQDDLVDLTRLRLDLIYAVQLSPGFEPRGVTWAYNVPTDAGSNASPPGYEVASPIPYGRPEPDFGQLIASLEAEFARASQTREVAGQRALLIHVGEKRRGKSMAAARASMRELESLAQTAGVTVVDSIIQLRDRIDPRLVLGKGRLESVLIRAIDLDADLLVFDQDLTPAQATAIARSTDLGVIDRSQLILDIFAQRAETRDGKLQVELAQLKYRLPRLGQKDDSLSRLTGGIGGRGPGETKLEIGRRRARERITRLERQLKTLAGQRAQRRQRRVANDTPVIAIVGYTNAGKSTLLNALTGADVLAEDKLFATLDTRARRLYLPSTSLLEDIDLEQNSEDSARAENALRAVDSAAQAHNGAPHRDGHDQMHDGIAASDAIIADTVGFIRNMPKDLFAAFRATFEEAADADLLLEVVDAPSPEAAAHCETTRTLLAQLGLDHIPRLTVYNKADLLSDEERDRYLADQVLLISALDKHSLRRLLGRIARELALSRARRDAEAERAAQQRLAEDVAML